MSKNNTSKYLHKATTREEKLNRRKNHKVLSYANKATGDDEYESIHNYVSASYPKYPARSFDDVDSNLSRNRNASRGKLTLLEDRAPFASCDAWASLNMRR